MKTIKVLLTFVLCSFSSNVNSQEATTDQIKIKEDLYQILNDISQYYAYQNDKNVDLNCLLEYYESQIPIIKTEEDTVLFFEYLLDEFYDNHLMLNTNRNASFRLYSPMYVHIKNDKILISNIWQTQVEKFTQNLIGAEVLKFNGIDFKKIIEEFPTHCNNKNQKAVRQWISNKILAGRYNQKRVLTLKTVKNEIIEIDLDKIKIKEESELLSTRIEKEVGIIRINNSLGNNNLISEFDTALNKLEDAKGIIIDLRNTVGGGNSYVARGIMGRFINDSKPYQKHQMFERFDGKEIIERSWTEYVSPRGKEYKKPVAILVGRWTGSMGEGLAIGFEGMDRAEIIGTEMERLAGEMNGFPFKHRNYSYRLSVAKLYHVNGTLREKYVPSNYINQTTTKKDEVLEKGIELIYTIAE